MADKLDIILKKLENIEDRLLKVEGGEAVVTQESNRQIQENAGLTNELLLRSIKLIQQYDVINSNDLQSKLGVDYEKAKSILEILEKEGFVGSM